MLYKQLTDPFACYYMQAIALVSIGGTVLSTTLFLLSVKGGHLLALQIEREGGVVWLLENSGPHMMLICCVYST